MRPRLVRSVSKEVAKLPPLSPEFLARHYERCTNILAGQAVDVQAQWLAVLELLERRGLLVKGEPVDPVIARMDQCVRALSKGPT